MSSLAATLVFGFVLAAAPVLAAEPASSGVKVVNLTSATVTVNTDLGYGCTANAGDACSFATSVGKRTMSAKRHDNDRVRTEEVTVTSSTYVFTLTDGKP